nr:MAG TPA_asm: hypothetical protein [Caudoviricetes sp.]
MILTFLRFSLVVKPFLQHGEVFLCIKIRR